MSNFLTRGVIAFSNDTTGFFPNFEYDGSNTDINTSSIWYETNLYPNANMSNCIYDAVENGGIYKLNGTTSRGTTNNYNGAITGQFTFLVWVRVYVGTWYYFMSEYGSTTSSRRWIMDYYTTDSINYYLRTVLYSGGSNNQNIGTTALNFGEWYHFAFTFLPGIYNRSFINGVPESSTGVSFTSINSSTPGIQFGYINASGTFRLSKCDLGYFSMFDRVLSDSEILDHYNATKVRFI